MNDWMRGLSAFPLTPLTGDRIDEVSLIRLISRLVDASVDSIAVLGSTGSYAYLDRSERRRVIHTAVRHAHDVPIIAGIGALRTSQVLACAEDAQRAGASALLLAPVSYQPLSDDEVYDLFAAVDAAADIPIVLYDNPTTTRFHFSLELYTRLCALERVSAVKIPPVPFNGQDPTDIAAAHQRVNAVRAAVGEDTIVGVSGDPSAAAGLMAGCDTWYSVVGGVLPEPALALTRAALTADDDAVRHHAEILQPLWELYEEYRGGVRVVAAIAEEVGAASADCLPLPVQGLDQNGRERLREFLQQL